MSEERIHNIPASHSCVSRTRSRLSKCANSCANAEDTRELFTLARGSLLRDWIETDWDATLKAFDARTRELQLEEDAKRLARTIGTWVISFTFMIVALVVVLNGLKDGEALAGYIGLLGLNLAYTPLFKHKDWIY